MLSHMYQKLVLYMFSNETFPFFTKLEEGGEAPPVPYLIPYGRLETKKNSFFKYFFKDWFS